MKRPWTAIGAGTHTVTEAPDVPELRTRRLARSRRYRPHLRIHAADIDHGDRRRAAADHS